MAPSACLQESTGSEGFYQLLRRYQQTQALLAGHPELRRLREEVRGRLAPTPRELLYREHSVAVHHYPNPNANPRGTPLLLVSSLVHQPWILDLLEGESLVQALLQRGFDVYLLEWGEPNRGQVGTTLLSYLEGYLERAVRRILGRSGSSRLDLLGISLGGLLALLYASLDRGERVRRLVTLVTPVGFHDEGLLSWWTRREHLPVDKLVDTWGNIPGSFFADGFPLIVPTPGPEVLEGAWDRGDRSTLDYLLALDLWISEGVDLPGQLYREVIRNGYQDDCLVRTGRWPLTRGEARLQDLRSPVLCLAGEEDRVAPVASCTRLAELLGPEQVTTRTWPTGHLGIALGRDAEDRPTEAYWDHLAEWLGAE